MLEDQRVEGFDGGGTIRNSEVFSIPEVSVPHEMLVFSCNTTAVQMAMHSLGLGGPDDPTVPVAVMVLGVGTLLRERWSTESILFWICTLTIGVWLTSFSFMYAAKDEGKNKVWLFDDDLQQRHATPTVRRSRCSSRSSVTTRPRSPASRRNSSRPPPCAAASTASAATATGAMWRAIPTTRQRA